MSVEGERIVLNNFFEWIKNHHRKTIAIMILSAVVLIFGIPITINICFKIPAPCKILEPEWEADNVLTYYGAILGFLGTTSLSMLALYQNYEIKKESDAKQAKIDEMEHEKEMPIFVIKNLHCAGNFGNLNLSIGNISDNVAYDLEVSNFKVESVEGECMCESKKVILERFEVLGCTENRIEFINDSFSGENLKMIFQIKCKDKFYKKHTYIVSANIKDASRLESTYRITEI